MTIFFDMDGTIADIYSSPNWLKELRAFRTSPYTQARPLVNMSRLAKALHRAQNNGVEIGIISWSSKVSTPDFDLAVAQAKRDWLARHLPSVKWDKIYIVAYGTPKQSFASPSDILFDDEQPNRTAWTGAAYEPDEMWAVLAAH